jgi:DedD protein
MGKAISDEELQLKKRARRRLVGAIALVLLIVVFLPMVLDNEPRPLNQDIAITIPPVPKPESLPSVPAPSQSAPQNAGAPANPSVAGMPTGESAAAGTANPGSARPESARPEQARADPKAAARPAQKEPKPLSVTAPADEETFVVQLGAFSNATNAKTLQKKLRDNKFKAYTEVVKNAGGDRVRVRVGPYPSREAAEKARERLKSMKLVIGEAAVVRRD